MVAIYQGVAKGDGRGASFGHELLAFIKGFPRRGNKCGTSDGYTIIQGVEQT